MTPLETFIEEKTMRKTLGVAALMLALCCPTLAGEIPTPPAPQPTGGEMQNGYMSNGIMQNESPDSLTQTVLELLAVLPSLL